MDLEETTGRKQRKTYQDVTLPGKQITLLEMLAKAKSVSTAYSESGMPYLGLTDLLHYPTYVVMVVIDMMRFT